MDSQLSRKLKFLELARVYTRNKAEVGLQMDLARTGDGCVEIRGIQPKG